MELCTKENEWMGKRMDLVKKISNYIESKGIQIDSYGNKYEGQWINDKKEGKGIFGELES